MHTSLHYTHPLSHVDTLTQIPARPLDPPLSENESFDLLKVCVGSAFALPPVTHIPEKTKDEEILDPKQREVWGGR